MRTVVTGAAGFIGSHLCEHLLAAGDTVLGIDSFTDHYDPAQKERNLVHIQQHPAFSLYRGDLCGAPLRSLLDGAEVIYHLAAQPGVRPSWGKKFELYTSHNVLATQVLLEAARDQALAKFVYASSSSVYGNAGTYPTTETAYPQPVSPYGVTKLAAEHLCELYRKAYGVPCVSLRLFTVYGPGQRPDMAFARLLAAAMGGEPFVLYGDGEQCRDFTYVRDVIRAMRDAACSSFTGVANLGGGHPVSMKSAIAAMERLLGPLTIVRGPTNPGDARHTAADISVAAKAFGFRPDTPLDEGLAAMAAHQFSTTPLAKGGR